MSSEFYPQLHEHYENVYEEWVAEWERVREADDAGECGQQNGEGVNRAS